MPADANVVAVYCAAPAHSYWRWDEDGLVITWYDGATIAFRLELIPILNRLRTQTLPPMGSLVLLLAACRESWSDVADHADKLRELLHTKTQPDRALLLSQVLEGLDRIHSAKPWLRSSPEAKAEVASMIFEARKGAVPPPERAFDRLIDELQHGLPEDVRDPSTTLNATVCLLRDLAWLQNGLKQFDEDALELRLKTGLEQLVQPVNIDVPATPNARSLIADLQDDAELGGIARLAKLLLAAVHLPRPMADPDELPLGGVTDICNRGSLDKLLLSELAYDSLALAVRVANNEALYLRREVPPRPPMRRRMVLLDSGLRMWGVPRVFAAAVGLAVAAANDDHTAIDLFRAEGNAIVPVDMTTAAGLTDHLAALTHHAHPGKSLAALREAREAADEAVDLVLVTGRDVLADRDFQRSLAEAQFEELYLATVERDGRFQLQLQTRRGRKPLQEAQFALEEVLEPRSKGSTSLIDESRANDLPAIFRAKPFPLLLSYNVSVERSWHVRDFGVLTYTSDGRLLHWQDSTHGARQIAEGLPPGNLHWASNFLLGGQIHAIIGKLSQQGLYTLQLSETTMECRCVQIEPVCVSPRSVFIHQDRLAIVAEGELMVFGLLTGKFERRISLNGWRHHRGRIFQRRATTSPTPYLMWGTPCLDETFEECHEAVVHALWVKQEKSVSINTVFDSVYHINPVGITDAGELCALSEDGEEMPLRRIDIPSPTLPVRVIAVSRDGSRAMMTAVSSFNQPYIVDLKTLKVIAVLKTSNANSLLEPALLRFARIPLMRRRFVGIGVNSHGKLTLVGKRGSLWPLNLNHRVDKLELPASNVTTQMSDWKRFELSYELSDNRYELSVARFPDGSRVTLDSRGLLHLQSSDRELAECTIVLAQGETAGWTSDGRNWGSRYFLGDKLPSSVSRIYAEIIQPFVERIS